MTVSNINIIDVIGYFIEIPDKQVFFILCPFHKEKTPSFYVNGDKNFYKCFGCNKGGSPLNFLMDYKNLSLRDSFKFIEKLSGKYNFNRSEKFSENIKANQEVASIYNCNLGIYKYKFTHIDNFLKKRNINNSMIHNFSIGYSLNCWNDLYNKYRNNSNKIKLLIDNGLILKSKHSGSFYDRFRNRIIFPIKNIQGFIVGFGGRVINEIDKPKYINSPESSIFTKSKILYGLFEFYQYKEKSTDEILIVEGYMDVISLKSKGIHNVVGILGTAFNINHFNILSRRFKRIIFCYDGDKAGKDAANRAAYLCIKNFNPSLFFGFVELPDGFDPDSFIDKFGVNNFINKVSKPVYLLDYIKILLESNSNYSSPVYKKISFVNQINILIKNINDHNIRKIILDFFFLRPIVITENIKNKIYETKIHNATKYDKIAAIILKRTNFSDHIDLNFIKKEKKINIKSSLFMLFEIFLVLRKFHQKDNSFIYKIIINNRRLKDNIFFEMLHSFNNSNLKEEILSVIKEVKENEKINY